MESVVTQIQPEAFSSNVTHDMDNVTSFIDGIGTDFWTKELHMSPEYKAAIFIQRFYSFILSAIGVPCNVLSFLILRRIKPITSALLIMRLLAIADSLNLMLTAFYRASRVLEISYTNIGCCIIMTARYLLQYMPIWLVVLLTLERVVAVCFPMKAAQVCTISNARRSIVILVILDVVICIVHTFIYEDRWIGTRSACAPKLNHERLHEQWMVADGVFFDFIPVIILCLSNMAIIITLRTSAGIPNETANSSISEENRRQNRSVTVMLLAVSITTIICLGPNLTYSLMATDFYEAIDVPPSTFARRQLAIWIIMFLTYANNAVNFFLYILSGRRFRSEFYDMVTSWFGGQKSIPRLSTNIRQS